MHTLSLRPFVAFSLCCLLAACGGDSGRDLPDPPFASSSSESSESSESSSSSSSEQSSSAASVAWNVYDGNHSPFASGAITLADDSAAEFTLGGDSAGMDESYFTVVGDGTVTFDTSLDPDHRHYASYDNIVADDGNYPKTFTLIAGITGPSEPSRVLDIEIAMADEGETGSRLKAIIRADGGNTGVQLERATDGGVDSGTSVSHYGLEMLDIFRVYHFAIELESATHGNVSVYADGLPLQNLMLTDVEMRPTSGEGDNYLRFGDTGSSAYQANIDWLIWTDADAFTPTQLLGALPDDIGCLQGYGDIIGDCNRSDDGGAVAPAPDFDFEDEAVGALPEGFDQVDGSNVEVSDERAYTGEQSLRMQHLVDEDVRVRKALETTETGQLSVAVFIPDEVGVDSFVTLYGGGYTGAGRVVDIIFKNGGAINRREGSAQSEAGQYNVGEWNLIKISWEDILDSQEYTLSVNGNELGSFAVTNPDLAPDRFELKFGQNSAAVSDVSIFFDTISGFDVHESGDDSGPGDDDPAPTEPESDFDFESDTVGAEPQGFDQVDGSNVTVSDERAYTGGQSLKMEHLVDEDVRVRQTVGTSTSGTLSAAVFIPEDVGIDTFVSAYAESFAGANRVVDIIFKNGGAINRREGNAQSEVAQYNPGEWNFIEVTWSNIMNTGEYTLTVNGTEVGTFPATNTGIAPDRFELKFGQNSGAISDKSVYFDTVTAF